jgi:hypothetical protein
LDGLRDVNMSLQNFRSIYFDDWSRYKRSYPVG